MYIHEYGDSKDPKIIMLAPMMLSGEDMYNIISPHLKGNYCIIAPDQGGYGKAGKYVNAVEEYRDLREYLIEKDYRKAMGILNADDLMKEEFFDLAARCRQKIPADIAKAIHDNPDILRSIRKSLTDQSNKKDE